MEHSIVLLPPPFLFFLRSGCKQERSAGSVFLMYLASYRVGQDGLFLDVHAAFLLKRVELAEIQ